jgi:hypothetical protein
VDQHLLEIFQYELGTQCKFIVIGGSIVDQQTHSENTDVDAVWFALQGMLISAANASKLLWGSKSSEDLLARKELRESVEVDEQSAFYSRKLRNDFEHFDERLEVWFEANAHHMYLGRNIGRLATLIAPAPKPGDIFGHFDPEAATVSFWERSTELIPLASEAERILQIFERRRYQ